MALYLFYSGFMSINSPKVLASRLVQADSFSADEVRAALQKNRIGFLKSTQPIFNTFNENIASVSHGQLKSELAPAVRIDKLSLLRGYESMLGNFTTTVSSAYSFLDNLTSLMAKSKRFDKSTEFNQSEHKALLVKSRTILRSALSQLTNMVNTEVLPLIAKTTGFDFGLKSPVSPTVTNSNRAATFSTDSSPQQLATARG